VVCKWAYIGPEKDKYPAYTAIKRKFVVSSLPRHVDCLYMAASGNFKRNLLTFSGALLTGRSGYVDNLSMMKESHLLERTTAVGTEHVVKLYRGFRMIYPLL
jgi:hypothetical protein